MRVLMQTRYILVLAAVTLACGCASSPAVKDLNARLTSLEMVSKKPPDATYVVDPPDSIYIEFGNEPDLTVTEQLRQDGVVVLPHVGEVKLAGMTTQQIREKLEETYAEFYKEPEFVVKVATYRSKHLYVYGEVRSQGTQTYTGYQTLSDVIGAAGGLTQRAKAKHVKVVRGDPDDPEVFRADVRKLIRQGDTSQDVSLAENDVVYVPPTALAWIGYRINEVLFPFRSAFSALGLFRTVEGD
jgi:polysaccharide export outer membrane protein